ncbi:MAG: hypothetical protein IJ097_02300 [Bacilli bacterium]|nr:hypothetical protein [Bacilli bacterium]
MSNREDYIDIKRKNIKKELEKIEKEYNKKELVSYGLIAFFGGLALCSVPVALNISLASAAITAGTICYNYKTGKKREIENKKLNQELKHLNNIEIEQPLTEKRLYDKACDKVIAISQTQIEEEKKYENVGDATNIMYAITAAGAIGTAINPLTAWIPVVGVCSSILSGNAEIRSFEKKEILDNRITNLLHDLETKEIEEKEEGKVYIKK